MNVWQYENYNRKPITWGDKLESIIVNLKHGPNTGILKYHPFEGEKIKQSYEIQEINIFNI